MHALYQNVTTDLLILYLINSQYIWKWTNANPTKIFGQLVSHPKLLIGTVKFVDSQFQKKIVKLCDEPNKIRYLLSSYTKLDTYLVQTQN